MSRRISALFVHLAGLHRWLRAIPLLLFLVSGLRDPLSAQELPWLQGGQARLDFAPVFWNWDSRYGLAGSGLEKIELLGADLTADALGSQVIPGLTTLEDRLREALDDPSYVLSLGASRAYIDQSRLVFPLRLDLGITDWLTIGGMVPFVRPRQEIAFGLNADSTLANAGNSPFLTNTAGVVNFLEALQGAVDQAQNSHPDAAVVQEARGFLNALIVAYDHGTFFPVQGSDPAIRLQERLDGFRSALADLGVSGVPNQVPLASEYLTEEAFTEFLTGSYMRAFPLEDWTDQWSFGDIELSASVRLLHGGFEPDSTGALPGVRYQFGLGGLVRLGTGDTEDPLRFFDQDVGNGQMDLEGSAFGLLELGSRFGVWGRGRYGVQQEAEIFRRIASPSHPLPEADRIAPVKWTPGNYLELDLNPRINLTRVMSLGARYRYWSKGEDSYSLGSIDPEVQDPAELPPADLLNAETEQTLQELGFSALYSTVDAHALGDASMPVVIRVTYFRPLSGSGGQTPKGGRFEAGVTIFKTLWGGDPSSQEPSPPGTGGR